MDSELEEKLKEKFGKDYEKLVEEKISSFGGLLTKSAAILLLCRENGVQTERKLPLSNAKGSRLPFSFEAKIDRIFPAQEYSGGAHSVRLHVSDRTGEATVVLWNEHAAAAERNLRAGDIALFSGAHFRDGEVSLGKNGAFEVRTSEKPARISELSHGLCSVEGVVREVEPDYHYVDKKTGEKKRLSSFLLCQGEECRRVVVWQPDGKTVPREGEAVLVENVQFRRSELHFNSGSRMVRKEAAGGRSGAFGGVELDGKKATFFIGKEKFAVALEDAMLLLGVRSIPDGVEIGTMVSIKAGSLSGKRVGYRLEGARLCHLAISEKS